MGQLKNLIASLALKQKISIAVAAALAIALVYAFVSWHKDQDFKPLYTGIAPEEAAAIVQKIKESGSEYRLSESGGIISVPSAQVAELRLQMAAAGLPKSGRIGFELFDKTNFGATDFVEHINYNRALEGELERSIDSLSAIEHSRVHITAPKDSVFVESREAGKASVIVGLRPGSTLFGPNVAAIQQLVGSAVEGVNPEDVSVVDTRGNLLSRRKAAGDGSSDASLSYRERVEHNLVEKINSTLEPLLGRDRFRAGVSAEVDLATSDQSEDTYDPTKSVMVSSQKSEEVMANGATAGIPGTPSNLPRPATRAGGPTNSTNRRTENISYESSHVVRKTHTPEGQIKRLSISVLLDQKANWEGKGKARKFVVTALPADTVKAVHDLVAGVAGFSQERGDQIIVESLPFEATLTQREPEELPASGGHTTWKDWLKNPKILMGGGAGLLLVGFLLGAALMILRKPRRGAVTAAPSLPAAQASEAKLALEAANAAENQQSMLAEKIAAQEREDAQALAALRMPTVKTKKTELLSKEIRESTKKDATISAQVLQSWMHED